MDKLDKEIKKYLEKELRDYDKNLKKLNELREEIIDSTPTPDFGMSIQKRKGGEQLTNKVYKLSSVAIVRLEHITNAINTIVLKLDPTHKEFYDKHFRRGIGKYRICMEMFFEERTFYNYKDKIIHDLAKELGYL